MLVSSHVRCHAVVICSSMKKLVYSRALDTSGVYTYKVVYAAMIAALARNSKGVSAAPGPSSPSVAAPHKVRDTSRVLHAQQSRCKMTETREAV